MHHKSIRVFELLLVDLIKVRNGPACNKFLAHNGAKSAKAQQVGTVQIVRRGTKLLVILIDEPEKDGHRDNQSEILPLTRREIERRVEHHLREVMGEAMRS